MTNQEDGPVTIGAIGKKADVARALTGETVAVWDGKNEVRMRPTTPITWRRSLLGLWRGEREAERI